MSDLRDRAHGREPSRGELALVEENKKAIIAMESAFAAALPSGVEARQIVRDAQTICALQPKLLECRRNTLLGALMTCAQLGLRPIPALGLAYVVPFRGNATFIAGYKGLAQLAHKSGQIRGITKDKIRARDAWSVVKGSDYRIVHKPAVGPPPDDPDERRKALDVVAYYSIVRSLGDGEFPHLMERWEVEEHRDKFALQREWNPATRKNDGAIKGPWVDHFDAMAIKTTLRFALGTAPQSVELQRAIALDERVRYDADPGVDAFQADTVPVGEVSEGEIVEDEDPTTRPGFGEDGFRG